MVRLLLPGAGGQSEQTVSVLEAGVTNADRDLDCSRCAQLAIQVSAATGIALQLKESFNGGQSFVSRGSPITLTNESITRLDITDGPFGILRFEFTSSESLDASDDSSFASSESSPSGQDSDDATEITLIVRGYPLQTGL